MKRPNRHFVMEAMHHRNPDLWQNMWGPKDQAMLKLLWNWTKPINAKQLSMPSGNIDEKMKVNLGRQKSLLHDHCSIYPYQVIKVVRLGFYQLQQLLKKSR